MKTVVLSACIIVVGLFVLFGQTIILRNEKITLEEEVFLLQIQRDSILDVNRALQRQNEAYREHVGECAFISRHQIKKVTNKRWIELYPNNPVPPAYRNDNFNHLISESK